MQKKIAFVFPGQGSQSVGMCQKLAEEFHFVKELFSEASELIHQDLWKIVSDGPEEILNQTVFTQPIMLITDIIYWKVWKHYELLGPSVLAGHSLGEYAALVAAEALSFDVAINCVVERSCLMQDAVPEGAGAMAVIVGLTDDEVIHICEVASKQEVCQVANLNSPGQVVIAGTNSAIDRALELAKHSRAKIAKRLPVSVPSHCQLMKPAAEKFSNYLEQIDIDTPKIPVIQNADLTESSNPNVIRSALIQQLYYPVRWIETIQTIINKGVGTIIECGPKKVLSNLNKRIDSTVEVIALSECTDYATILMEK